jgi:hypothetical protein
MADAAGDELLDVIVILSIATRAPVLRGSALLGFVREDAAYLAGRITSAPPPFRAGRSGGQRLGRQQWMAR